MTKKRKQPEINWQSMMQLIELRQAVSYHCTALKAVIALLEENNIPAAISRLDGAVTVLKESSLAMVSDLTIPCPYCGSNQDVRAWCEENKCQNCAGYLDAKSEAHP